MEKRKPTIKHIEVSQNTAELVLRIDEDILDFKGHFAHFPLLPGVTQIDWALFYAIQYLKTPTAFKGMEVIKFQEPILPNSTVHLALSWDGEKGKLAFKYTSGSHDTQNTHSSGKMKLGQPSE